VSNKCTDTYFISRKSKLLKDFDNLMKTAKSIVIARYGDQFAETLARESRQEYSRLIPQIPDVGDGRLFIQFITATAQTLALYRVLISHGKTLEEAGRLYYLLCETVLNSYPRFMHRLIGYLSFSGIARSIFKKRALESQKRLYPGGYVYYFVEGDGKEFDYGVDYSECGGCKFLSEQGAHELAPYICTADIIYSELFGWGLNRTMTIAEGFEKCNFRFKKGGKTRVASNVIKA